MNKLLSLPFAVVLFWAAGVTPAAAQATELTYDHHVLGDRSLTIQLGPMFPVAFQSFSGTFAKANLTVGGTMGLDLDFYLDDHWKLGGGLRGMAAWSPNANTLFMVPITFRTTYEFKLYPFSFPVGLGAGFTFTNYQTYTSFDPTLIPTVGAYWNMSSSWSFGGDLSQWLVFQPFYSKPADSRLGYFTDFTLGAIYHF
jgi:hypothetical protein